MENRPRPHHEVPIEEVNRLWNQASHTEQGYKKGFHPPCLILFIFQPLILCSLALLDHLEHLKKLAVTLERFRRIANVLFSSSSYIFIYA